METTSRPPAPTGLSLSVSQADSSDELHDVVLQLLKKCARGLAHPKTRSATLWLLLKIILFSGCAGVVVAAVAALGQTLAIGFVPASKLYGRWWVFSPLVGCALLLFVLLAPLLLKGSELVITGVAARISGRHLSAPASIAFSLLVALAFMLAIAGYVDARNEYPLLSSTANDIEAIGSAAQQQTKVLNNVSATSESLLQQLTATEKELAEAKQQLRVTLANFNEQRQSADRASEEMKRLDARRVQIAVKTAELERILEGHAPITREDLVRSSTSSLFYGAALGFLPGLVTYVFKLFQKKRKAAQEASLRVGVE